MIVKSGYMKFGFDASDGRILKKEDMNSWINSERMTDPRGVALGLGGDVEEVEPDFFEILPTVKSVWIENPECNLNLDEKTVKLFQKNMVILRGVYDTAAEKLARKHRLRFLHFDVQIASVGDYFDKGKDTITIRFNEYGRVYVNQDCRCQGISAGSTGGGESNFDLPADFYLMKPNQIAEKCWHTNRIIGSGKLAAFMKMAREKNGYLLDFSRDK